MATEAQRELSRHLRIIIKELGWLMTHVVKIYNMTKAEEEPPVEDCDPNQLKMFEDEETDS